MLDFYIINDTQENPQFPEEISLEYAGGLTDKTFADLQKINLIEKELRYYTDFRWTNEAVKIKYSLAESKSTDTSVIQFIAILQNALKQDAGLIAYCD